jgi:hypothetical protein
MVPSLFWRFRFDVSAGYFSRKVLANASTDKDRSRAPSLPVVKQKVSDVSALVHVL